MSILEPKRYQREVLHALKNARKEGTHSALVVMATGLGKTFTSAFDVEEYMSCHEGRALFLCHNNGILAQNMAAFQYVLDGEFSYGLFNGIEKVPDADFVFASFQTMLDYKEEFATDAFSYIVVDEAHHAPAETFRTVIDYFQPDFLLGMTATPERPDGLKLESIFGPVTYNLGLIEAIKRGLLVDIDYHLVLDEMAELGSLTVDGEKISMGELNRRLFIPKRDEEIARIISERLAEYPGSSTLIFCRTIEHAENMSALLDGSEVVHSKMAPDENKAILDRFRRGDLPIIISVDQLNEGIDVPHADVIVFLRSTASQIVFYQQLGRGLRLHEGKDHATVLDFVGNYKRLETLATMQRELNAPDDLNDEDFLGEDFLEEGTENEHFVLNIEASQFTDRRVNIFDVLGDINDIAWGWSNEELFAQVRMLAEELGRAPSRREFDKDPRTASATTAARHFDGKWNKFIEAAGLDPNAAISTEELFAQARMLAEELGRAPFKREFNEDPRTASSDTARSRFDGSWNKFLEAAGLEPNVISTEELFAQARMLAEELGRAPFIREFNEDPRTAGSTTAISRFDGSWNKFLEAAGLEPNVISTEELLAQVRMLAEELGRAPSSSEFDKNPRTASSDAAMSRFDGKWNKFLEAAGLEPIKKTLTTEELFVQVRMLAEELGRAPSRREFDKDPRTASSDTARSRFDGSWNKFLEAAGLEPNVISTEELFVQVRMLAEELGRAPTTKEFDKDPRTASSATAIRRFGGKWNRFLEAAGLRPNMIKGRK